jgi:hypothetical protein
MKINPKPKQVSAMNKIKSVVKKMQCMKKTIFKKKSFYKMIAELLMKFSDNKLMNFYRISEKRQNVGWPEY